MKNIFTRLFLMQSIIGVYLRMILLTFMKELKLLSCEKNGGYYARLKTENP